MRPTPRPPLSLIERLKESEFGTESTRRSTRRLTESRRGKGGKGRPGVVLIGSRRKEMPSVEMRRTTRVFGMGMAKGGMDGARVLRSGRRLWPESAQANFERTENGDEDWLSLVKNPSSDSSVGLKNKRWAAATTHIVSTLQKSSLSDPPVVKKPEKDDLFAHELKEHRIYGIVYTRKRKRSSSSANLSANEMKEKGSEDRMYGRRFVRRQRRKKIEELDIDFACPELLRVSFESSGGRSYWAARFLYSILVYMTRTRLGLAEFSVFLASDLICRSFGSCGIHFPQVPSCTRRSGICKFFGVKQFIPLFSVDFSAVPLCFMRMHARMHLRYMFRPTVNYLISGYGKDYIINQCDEDDVEEEVLCIENRPALHSSVRVPKLSCRNPQFRAGLSSRGIQKRRSSLRRRRSRIPSVALRKPNGALVSELVNIRKNGLSFSSGATNQKVEKSTAHCSTGNLKAVISTMEGSTRELDSTCCSANILITEVDKCYREDGATVMLEMGSTGEWFLVVKKDGLTRYIHKAEEVMRPCFTNRLTNVIMWSADNNADNSWKLEFPNRSDWYIFKDLYKECSDRFVPAPAVKCIPVPGVCEVAGYADSPCTPFCRPDSYLSLKDDEFSRAMAKRNANYDMDSDDEVWLNKFNSDHFAENEPHDHVSEDKFELMVDSFEKAFYYRPYDFSDENAASNLCLDMGRREVVEAVYSYWMNKRKQKRLSSLLRVFQANQSKRALLDPKPVMRKKRSFKRQASQSGRGKQLNFLQAMAAEQDALEEQNAMLKVEGARAAAGRSVELAIRKRQRAQLLMQNADLATYKATMAFRIAEAAQVVGSPDAAAAYVLD